MDDKGKGFKGENSSEFSLRLKDEGNCSSFTCEEWDIIKLADKDTDKLSDVINKLRENGFSEFKIGIALEIIKTINNEAIREYSRRQKRKIIITIHENIVDDDDNIAALSVDMHGVDRIEFCKIINLINQKNKEGIKNDLLELKSGALGLAGDKKNKLFAAMLAKGMIDLQLDEKKNAEALERRQKAFGRDSDSSKDNKNDNNKNGEKK